MRGHVVQVDEVRLLPIPRFEEWRGVFYQTVLVARRDG
ncbi:hypothetical protein AAW51_0874 [Caldimonas brevitalea]|uniref:Uncharacterized protein n=1 Tax=Caldimonas brevitalea TaxID=413882 RepID=A0A0G3BLX7_9BURK|nr:hypothetical protein AAW51_0874 [Caldimonas brevitalea]